MELKILVKNTSFLITTRTVQFLVEIIKAKLVAITLGIFGAGIISQLKDITSKMADITLMSVNNGLVKQIAEKKTSVSFDKTLTELLKSYIAVIIIITIVALVPIYIFSKEITVYIFGDVKYYNYFMVGFITVPILIANSISFGILKGFKEIKYIAQGQIIVSIINIIVFIPLIYLWGITGAIISIPIYFVSNWMINNHYAKKKTLKNYNIGSNIIQSASISKFAVKELFVFAGVGILSGSAFILSEIGCRSIVVTQLGIEKLGLYSPVVGWASLFVGFIMPSLTTYLYPRFSEAKSDKEISGVLNDVLRLVSFMMLPILLLAVPLKFIIIPLFYSKEFITAGYYLSWHFLGQLIYLWMFSLRAVFTPIGRIKLHGTLVIFMSLINVAVVYLFVPIYGLYGYMLKFIISPIIFFPLCFFFLKKIIKFSIDRKNIFIMIYVLTSTLIVIAFSDYSNFYYLIKIVIGISLIIASYWFLSSSEKTYLMRKIKSGLRFSLGRKLLSLTKS